MQSTCNEIPNRIYSYALGDLKYGQNTSDILCPFSKGCPCEYSTFTLKCHK